MNHIIDVHIFLVMILKSVINFIQVPSYSWMDKEMAWRAQIYQLILLHQEKINQ